VMIGDDDDDGDDCNDMSALLTMLWWYKMICLMNGKVYASNNRLYDMIAKEDTPHKWSNLLNSITITIHVTVALNKDKM
jgi:hypothetical protein